MNWRLDNPAVALGRGKCRRGEENIVGTRETSPGREQNILGQEKRIHRE